ncbi:Kinesin-like protein bimC [Yarrowia sp. C11]|nr:Kinesin-like protein bimC [Yarrowia sp. C11]
MSSRHNSLGMRSRSHGAAKQATGTASLRRQRTATESPAPDAIATTSATASNQLQKSISGENIKVVVRSRTRNEREKNQNSEVVVDASEADATITVNDNQRQKTFTVDQVYGPESDQNMVYDGVVAPVLQHVMDGINCTIFAYGQTGTGKTYTMVGDVEGQSDVGGLSHEAGIIPRVLHSLFRRLEIEGLDYAVKCTFLELYNEDIRDLNDTTEKPKTVKLFVERDGVKVDGLDEVYLNSSDQGLDVLREGLRRRHVAATQMNDHSSRSHMVFTLTLSIMVPGSMEVARTAKINLVDLAGSESIKNSGAVNKQAVEAGKINKSLLTLGRVINALVDKAQHVPYRDSNLTRLLYDSLGGATRTYIIATVSPARVNLEETVNTLEYASRAKNIKNKPQMNQIQKRILLKEFTVLNEKLRSDLLAAQRNNGFQIAETNYRAMEAELASLRTQTAEQQRKLEVFDGQMKRTRDDAEKSQVSYLAAKRELDSEKSKTKQAQNAHETLKNSMALMANQTFEHVSSMRSSQLQFESALMEKLESSSRIQVSSLESVSSSIKHSLANLGDQFKVVLDTQNQSASTTGEIVAGIEKVKEELAGRVAAGLEAAAKSWETGMVGLQNEMRGFSKQVSDSTGKISVSLEDAFKELNAGVDRQISAFDDKQSAAESELASLVRLLANENQKLTERLKTHQHHEKQSRQELVSGVSKLITSWGQAQDISASEMFGLLDQKVQLEKKQAAAVGSALYDSRCTVSSNYDAFKDTLGSARRSLLASCAAAKTASDSTGLAHSASEMTAEAKMALEEQQQALVGQLSTLSEAVAKARLETEHAQSAVPDALANLQTSTRASLNGLLATLVTPSSQAKDIDGVLHVVSPFQQSFQESDKKLETCVKEMLTTCGEDVPQSLSQYEPAALPLAQYTQPPPVKASRSTSVPATIVTTSVNESPRRKRPHAVVEDKENEFPDAGLAHKTASLQMGATEPPQVQRQKSIPRLVPPRKYRKQ